MKGLYHQEYGSGEVLVLLPGFCESISIWDKIVQGLGKTCRVICIDLPGIGKSAHLKAPISLSHTANQIHSFIRSLGIQRYTVAGHSLGGYLSLELIDQFPESIDGIGMIHSTAFADDEEKISVRKKTIDFVNKRGVELFIKSFVPQLFRDKKSPYITTVINSAKFTTQDSLVNYTIAMMNRKNHTLTLEKWNKRSLFVAGMEDSLVLLAQSRAHLEYISEEKYVELANIGHMGMLEEPVLIEKCLRDLVCTTSK